LREAQTELVHVSRVTTMGELAASIAHELNQPLTGVVTNAKAGLRWLAGDAPNLDEVGEAMNRIIRDGNEPNGAVFQFALPVREPGETASQFHADSDPNNTAQT